MKTAKLVLLDFIFLIQVRLRKEVQHTPSSTQLGFKLMASRSWQYISCHWAACSNHLAISDFTLLKFCVHNSLSCLCCGAKTDILLRVWTGADTFTFDDK